MLQTILLLTTLVAVALAGEIIASCCSRDAKNWGHVGKRVVRSLAVGVRMLNALTLTAITYGWIHRVNSSVEPSDALIIVLPVHLMCWLVVWCKQPEDKE